MTGGFRVRAREPGQSWSVDWHANCHHGVRAFQVFVQGIQADRRGRRGIVSFGSSARGGEASTLTEPRSGERAAPEEGASTRRWISGTGRRGGACRRLGQARHPRLRTASELGYGLWSTTRPQFHGESLAIDALAANHVQVNGCLGGKPIKAIRQIVGRVDELSIKSDDLVSR